MVGATTTAIMLTSAVLHDDGYAGRTGAPGEQTCVNGCHNTYALNSGSGSIALTSADLVGWEYVPGATYHLSVTVSLASSGLFGFGVECLTASGANAGLLTVTNALETQVENATVLGNSRRNIVHQLNGGVGEGSKTFNFDWTAPATDIGAVTFYFAGNASNGNGASSGDRIYTGSQVVSPANTTGMDDLVQGRQALAVAPSPFDDRCTVTYSTYSGGEMTVTITDLEGRVVERRVHGHRAPGRHVEVLEGLSHLAEGTYLVSVDVAGAVFVGKVVRHTR